MFFVVSVCNNYAFNFNIPMPLHMIFRAGSLIANMAMGIVILNKNGKEIKSLQQKNVDHVPTTPWDDFFWWILGISLLTIALFISAGMGIYQEMLYSRYALFISAILLNNSA
ncbi:udp-xylose and udp-n-acetylglucosamine transporter-like protein [Lasius niger]|uniref:Udp-xylose and udp-n-acetylglucosamine transporter-like protein n=1 Tax=Lasius niger TaxID=67767 RepID=A0A0J7KNP2_LASNI|nr:udp-xylose and udp-n-acetylglucosamine transporter-like protein [Lasius niger]